MKTAFDTNGILFRLLNGHTSANGGVFVEDDRPDNSTHEDIVVNSIDLGQDALPQVGTSNINVYVPDMEVKIGGKMQLQANRARLKTITDEVLAIVRASRIEGLKIIVMNHTTMNEPNMKQHFSNIRVDWNIQKY